MECFIQEFDSKLLTFFW